MSKRELMALCAGLMMMLSAPAFADVSPDSECMADSDCQSGWTCDVVGGSACAVPAPRDPDDPDGGDMTPECEPMDYKACVPPPPESCDPNAASDCDSGEVCLTYSFETCAGGDVPPCVRSSDGMEDCPDVDPDPPVCNTESESYCVPKYLAPCQADADCGTGFTCEEEEICSCSGGGSTGSDGAPGPGDDDPGDSEPDCSCQPSGTKYCQLQPVECDAANPCPTDFSCETEPSPDTPETCVIDSMGDETCSDSTPDPQPAPKSYCIPQGYLDYGITPGSGGVDVGGSGTPRASFDEAVAESTGNGNSKVTTSGWEDYQEPIDENGGDSDAAGGGCSVSPGQEHAPASGLLAMLMMGLAVLRRRIRS